MLVVLVTDTGTNIGAVCCVLDVAALFVCDGDSEETSTVSLGCVDIGCCRIDDDSSVTIVETIGETPKS